VPSKKPEFLAHDRFPGTVEEIHDFIAIEKIHLGAELIHHVTAVIAEPSEIPVVQRKAKTLLLAIDDCIGNKAPNDFLWM
jgi:hypothetical protein